MIELLRVDETVSDLYAMCERNFKCGLLHDTYQMCVTCRAAHLLADVYLGDGKSSE